jgi:hypothetical protein
MNRLTALPSAEYIRERLAYDPNTGVLTWRYCEAMRREWNTRYSGAVAGADSDQGYRSISIDDRPHRAHRLAWLIMHGEWPVDQLDHINGDRADNRISNLRDVGHTENCRNAATPRNNTSGVVGVRQRKATGKWEAKIKVDYRTIHLGYFANLADAIAARLAAEITYGFHSNHGRTAA